MAVSFLKTCLAHVHLSIQETFKEHLKHARPSLLTDPAPHGLALPEVGAWLVHRYGQVDAAVCVAGPASGLRAGMKRQGMVCTSSFSQSTLLLTADLHGQQPLLPLATQAESPSPGTHQNLILQTGDHSNHERHWGERREGY